jgi:hypothetical protein
MAQVSTVPAPVSNAEAMDMVLTGLRYLAAADLTAMAAQAQAECLLALEQGDALSAAVRARILAAFTAGRGYSADADYSPTSWLIHRTRITKGQDDLDALAAEIYARSLPEDDDNPSRRSRTARSGWRPRSPGQASWLGTSPPSVPPSIPRYWNPCPPRWAPRTPGPASSICMTRSRTRCLDCVDNHYWATSASPRPAQPVRAAGDKPEIAARPRSPGWPASPPRPAGPARRPRSRQLRHRLVKQTEPGRCRAAGCHRTFLQPRRVVPACLATSGSSARTPASASTRHNQMPS